MQSLEAWGDGLRRHALAVEPAGFLAAAFREEGATLTLLPLRTADAACRLAGRGEAVAFSPDGSLLVHGDRWHHLDPDPDARPHATTLVVRRVPGWEPVASIKVPADADARGFRVTPDNRRLVMMDSSSLMVVDLAAGAVRRAALPWGLAASALSADGRAAALAWKRAPSTIEVWDRGPGP